MFAHAKLVLMDNASSGTKAANVTLNVSLHNQIIDKHK